MAKTSAKKSENSAKKGTQTNMWTGRFASGMAQSMVDLSFSLQFDAELIEEDIEGSIGHGKGLVESGVLSKADYKKICDGLASILKDYKAGKKAAAGFFVGQVMKLSKGKADPKIVGRIVAEKLSAL